MSVYTNIGVVRRRADTLQVSEVVLVQIGDDCRPAALIVVKIDNVRTFAGELVAVWLSQGFHFYAAPDHTFTVVSGEADQPEDEQIAELTARVAQLEQARDTWRASASWHVNRNDYLNGKLARIRQAVTGT